MNVTDYQNLRQLIDRRSKMAWLSGFFAGIAFSMLVIQPLLNGG